MFRFICGLGVAALLPFSAPVLAQDEGGAIIDVKPCSEGVALQHELTAHEKSGEVMTIDSINDAGMLLAYLFGVADASLPHLPEEGRDIVFDTYMRICAANPSMTTRAAVSGFEW